MAKLNNCEAEAAETQVWLKFSAKFGYMKKFDAQALYKTYDRILGSLVKMINNPENWLL